MAAAAAPSANAREYCLRWNNHQPNLAQFFVNLYSSESLVDVSLVSAEGKKVQAHKLVLSACSPYFQSVFESNPCKHPIVILKDVNFSDLEAIVKFIYNGEVNISQDKMGSILKTANSLQVKGLAEVPAEELKRVSSVVGEPSARSNAPLNSSASWDFSDSGVEVPRKKLKKSASATASYGSIGPASHTNGEHSVSVDSGVGASIGRSLDDGSPTEEYPTVVQKRASLPAPPPLMPKSKSLDIHRDANDDTEMSTPFSEHQRQSYDDSSVGYDRGYDLEIAEDGIEGEYEEGDGEAEYYGNNGEGEEEYYDEDYGYIYDESLETKPAVKSIRPHSLAGTSRPRESLPVPSVRFSNGPVFRRRSERTDMDPERLEQAMEYLRNGATYREAAAKFGFSKTYLWHRSRQYGVSSRKPGIRPLVKEDGGDGHSSDNHESSDLIMNQVQDTEMLEDHTAEANQAETGAIPIPQVVKAVPSMPRLKGGPLPRVKILPSTSRFMYPASQS